MGPMKQIGIDVDVHRSIEQARRSFSETENDILRRLLCSNPAPRPVTRPVAPSPLGTAATRSRGLWTVEIKGTRTPAANLKDAYKTLLIQLGSLAPDFLESFAKEKSRSRRFVAREPGQLYASSPHLAAEHARLLKDGWYFDTNLSTEQVSTRVRVAARLVGLKYGRDVRIMENLREI